MTKLETVFLAILRAELNAEKPMDPMLNAEEWMELLRLSERHKLLPLILDAACRMPSYRSVGASAAANSAHREQRVSAADEYSAPAATDTPSSATEPRHSQPGKAESEAPSAGCGADPSALPSWKEIALEQAARQALQENEFLNLVLSLHSRGLDPIVMKGPVCRALYPKPLLRPSVDDDLLIPEDQGPAYHAAFLDYGMTADDVEADPAAAWELSYHMPRSPLYVELHKRLFDPKSDAFKGFNALFEGAVERAVPIQIQDVCLKTLAPFDHLLFLSLHAIKHFIYSGFGVRIVSDVCLFSRAHAEEIDFSRITEVCAELRCEQLTAAIYRIGEKYLGIPAPEPIASVEVDEGPLLEDVLAAGLHGAHIDRVHSANITLRTVAEARQGAARSGGLHASLFPAREKLTGAYPFLERRPWLLPVAWTRRLGSYLKQRRIHAGQIHPTASLRIGRERVALLEEYNIVDPKAQRG